jgi:hypothetical protein
MKTFYRNDDGKIKIMQTASDEMPAPHGWEETNNHELYKYDGEKIEWFNKDVRIPDSVLVEKGQRFDKRGRWYRKDNPHETKLIQNLDEDIEDGWTLEIPIENEQYQNFDGNKWVVDTIKKERAEKQNRLNKLISKIEDVERQQFRSFKAIKLDKATKEDTDKFFEYETQIEELRAQITPLQKELRSE